MSELDKEPENIFQVIGKSGTSLGRIFLTYANLKDMRVRHAFMAGVFDTDPFILDPSTCEDEELRKKLYDDCNTGIDIKRLMANSYNTGVKVRRIFLAGSNMTDTEERRTFLFSLFSASPAQSGAKAQ
jgi:hypothetical protein